MNFAIQWNDRAGKEASAIIQYAILEQIPYKMVKDINSIPKDCIPVGSVEYCLKALGRKIKPDYYPEFLKQYLYREVWETNIWTLGKKLFIKPADRYKRFNGFVTNGGYKGKKRPPYWCSEIVKFNNEWRYYVANGKILTGEWYSGDEINTPDAPLLDIEIPDNYCGAIDFGELSTGKLALVEANHPFACGWYGKDYKLYAEWIIKGWEYMLNDR